MKKKDFKLMLIAGHGQGDSGACGNGHKECDITRDLVNRICKVAISKGILVDLYNPLYNAVKQIKAGNIPSFAGHTYCLEVHCNSSTNKTARGSMFYIHKDEAGWRVEQNILNRLYALGSRQAWDGVVKSNRQWESGLIVQNRCKEQGVSHGLLETFFISNVDDVNWYFTNKDKIAEEIINGIIEGFNIEDTVTVVNETPVDTSYTNWIGTVVNCKELNIRSGAGMKYDISRVIPVNINVEVFEEYYESPNKKWYHVKICDDVLGWVYSGYIQRV